MAVKGVMPAGLKRYWAARRAGKKVKSKGVRTMAVKGAKRKKKGFTLSLAVVAGFLPLASHIQTRAGGQIGNYPTAIIKGLQTGMGYNPDTHQWAMGNAKIGIIPIAGGLLAHKLASKLGFNRALAGAGIPFIRI